MLILISISLKFNIGIRHKIHNFYLNYFFLSIYIIYYIIAIGTFRWYAWGKYLDLKPFFNTFAIQFIENPLIFFIQLLLLILIFIWLSKLRLYLLKEVRKRHIFQYNYYNYYYLKIYINGCKQANKTIETGLEYIPLYTRFCDRLGSRYSCDRVYARVLGFINKTIPQNTIFQCKDTGWMIMPKFILLFVNKAPFLLLLTIVVYECISQNWILHYIFFYLPIYFIYMQWFTISNFLTMTHTEINRIIYERYYEEDHVLYSNTTDEEDKFFDTYLKDNLRNPAYFVDWTNKFAHSYKTVVEWKNLFLYWRRYVRTDPNTLQFWNDAGEGFEMEQKAFEDLKNSKVD